MNFWNYLKIPEDSRHSGEFQTFRRILRIPEDSRLSRRFHKFEKSRNLWKILGFLAYFKRPTGGINAPPLPLFFGEKTRDIPPNLGAKNTRIRFVVYWCCEFVENDRFYKRLDVDEIQSFG